MKQIHLFNWFKTPAFLVLLMLVGLIFYSCSDTTSTNSTIKKAESLGIKGVEAELANLEDGHTQQEE